jgi:hypothetical protein
LAFERGLRLDPRQAAGETNAPLNLHSFGVAPPMPKGGGKPADFGVVNRPTITMPETENSAHLGRLR